MVVAGERRPETLHRYPLSRAFFHRFCFQTQFDALRTNPSALSCIRVGLSKIFPPRHHCLSATETTFTTWTSCDYFSLTFFCVLTPRRLAESLFHTGYEPKSEIDMAGRFVPTVDLTHDDEDNNSHMSDIPLQRPARANVISNVSHKLRATSCGMFQVSHPIPSQTGQKSLANTQTEGTVICHSTIPSGWEATLCQYFGQKRRGTTNTTATCRCKFGNSNIKQMRDFSRRRRELLSRFSKEAYQALEDQREILVTEVTSEVRRRDEQVHDLRTDLSLEALHAEHVSQQHLTGLVQETQQYREMFEESRSAQSAAGPEIDRLRRREKELLRELRRHSYPRGSQIVVLLAGMFISVTLVVLRELIRQFDQRSREGCGQVFTGFSNSTFVVLPEIKY